MRMKEKEDEKIRIASLIRQFRRSANMTQIDLAERMGITYQQVQKYEKGKSEFTIRRLMQAAEALNMPLSVFIGESENSPPILTDEETDVLNAFRKIEDKALKRMAQRFMMSISEIQKPLSPLKK